MDEELFINTSRRRAPNFPPRMDLEEGDGYSQFDKLVIAYIDKFNNVESREAIEDLLNETEYPPSLENLILSAWKSYCDNSSNINIDAFVKQFKAGFNNSQLSQFAKDEVIERNKIVLDTFNRISEQIEVFQSEYADELLRKRIVRDHNKIADNYAVLQSLSTPFVMVTLICDNIGAYRISCDYERDEEQLIPKEELNLLTQKINECIIHLSEFQTGTLTYARNFFVSMLKRMDSNSSEIYIVPYQFKHY